MEKVKQPLYYPNKKYLEIKEINDDYKSEMVPEQTIVIYNNALLTPTNHLFVKSKYIPAGLITTNDDKKLKFHLQLYLFLKSKFFTKILYHNGTFLFAHDDWSNNYYHWMCEALPRFHKMQIEYPEAVIILPKQFIKYTFISDSLNLLALNHIWFDSDLTHRFKKLITIQTIPRAGIVDQNLQNNLKSSIFKQLNLRLNYFPRRKLYISRSKAEYRIIENENEIIPLLIESNYEIVYAEKLSLKEQIMLFSEAKAVIGLHGAGLTNIIFMSSGKVMEIRNRSWTANPLCYWRLANTMSLRWNYHPADSSGNSSNFNNVSIDIPRFINDFSEFERI